MTFLAMSRTDPLHLWDVSTSDLLKVMMGYTDSVNSVAFSANSAWLASGSHACSVRMWDTSKGGQLRIMKGHTDTVTSVAFSADGSKIISGLWDPSIWVWTVIHVAREYRTPGGRSVA
ncbi:hypothetical protein CVT25_008517 [Psilocybe cyanescens]|uniref:Uncharacterized protein n=1 Tax=Psilocybe cyanescens TaxID=93625 RepID=A0A409XNK1_PSICY|nr:hypothetical protein CVT25_008517 [Psilocybe cyanescens]